MLERTVCLPVKISRKQFLSLIDVPAIGNLVKTDL